MAVVDDLVHWYKNQMAETDRYWMQLTTLDTLYGGYIQQLIHHKQSIQMRLTQLYKIKMNYIKLQMEKYQQSTRKQNQNTYNSATISLSQLHENISSNKNNSATREQHATNIIPRVVDQPEQESEETTLKSISTPTSGGDELQSICEVVVTRKHVDDKNSITNNNNGSNCTNKTTNETKRSDNCDSDCNSAEIVNLTLPSLNTCFKDCININKNKKTQEKSKCNKNRYSYDIESQCQQIGQINISQMRQGRQAEETPRRGDTCYAKNKSNLSEKSIINNIHSKAMINKKLDKNDNDDYSYKCKICGEKKPSKQQLIKHSKTHIKVKGYHCNLCNRSFVHKSDFKSHVNLHKPKCLPASCIAPNLQRNLKQGTNTS